MSAPDEARQTAMEALCAQTWPLPRGRAVDAVLAALEPHIVWRKDLEPVEWFGSVAVGKGVYRIKEGQ